MKTNDQLIDELRTQVAELEQRLGPTRELDPDEQRVTIETHAESGYVLLKQHGAMLARTKSIKVARRIRDALNSPHALVGQRVRTADVREDSLPSIEGVVMAIVTLDSTPAFILRLDDNTLETMFINGSQIVEPEAPEPVSWEP